MNTPAHAILSLAVLSRGERKQFAVPVFVDNQGAEGGRVQLTEELRSLVVAVFFQPIGVDQTRHRISGISFNGLQEVGIVHEIIMTATETF